VIQYFPDGATLRHPTNQELRYFPTLWPTLPPEQNASTWYLKADTLQAQSDPPPGSGASPDAYAGDLAALEKWIEANRPALDVLLEGNKLDYCRYPFFMSRKSGLSSLVETKTLGGIRALALRCRDAGIVEELKGHPDAAVDWHLANIRMGTQVSHGAVLQNLVGTGIIFVGMGSLDSLIANAALSDESLREIIAGCLAAESSIPEWADTMKCEKEYTWELMRSGGLGGKFGYFFLGARRGLNKSLEEVGTPLYILLAGQEAQDILHGKHPKGEGLLAPVRLPWYAVVGRGDVSLRATRIRAAIALYQRENGKLPDNLDALCPKFLPTVPLDPFSGKPLRYEKTQDGWKLWSVGSDLKDDGGTVNDAPHRIDDPDYVFTSNVKTTLDRIMRVK